MFASKGEGGDASLRVLVLGDPGVGKSSMLRMFTERPYLAGLAGGSGDSWRSVAGDFPARTVGSDVFVRVVGAGSPSHRSGGGTARASSSGSSGSSSGPSSPLCAEFVEVGGGAKHSPSRHVLYQQPFGAIVLVHDLGNAKSLGNLRAWCRDCLGSVQWTECAASGGGGGAAADDVPSAAFDAPLWVDAGQKQERILLQHQGLQQKRLQQEQHRGTSYPSPNGSSGNNHQHQQQQQHQKHHKNQQYPKGQELDRSHDPGRGSARGGMASLAKRDLEDIKAHIVHIATRGEGSLRDTLGGAELPPIAIIGTKSDLARGDAKMSDPWLLRETPVSASLITSSINMTDEEFEGAEMQLDSFLLRAHECRYTTRQLRGDRVRMGKQGSEQTLSPLMGTIPRHARPRPALESIFAAEDRLNASEENI